jgi:hypothetical protein
MAYRPERGWGFSHNAPSSTEATELEDLQRRVAELENGLREQGVKRPKLRKAEETVSAPEMIKAGGE